MPILRDKTSYPVTPEIMSIIDPHDLITWAITDYNGEGNLVQQIQKHEYSWVGPTTITISRYYS